MPSTDFTSKLAFLHAIDPAERDGAWRVFPAFILSTTGREILGKYRKLATLLFIDSRGGIRIQEEEHFRDRTSAVYWVEWGNVGLLLANISDDWNHRHLWREAHQDAIGAWEFVSAKPVEVPHE